MVKNQTSVLYCEEGFSEPLHKEHTKQFPGLWRSALSAIWSRQKTQLGLKHRGHVVFPQPPGVLLSHAGLSVKEEQVLSKEQPEGPVAIWSTRSGHQNLDLIISGIHVVITRLLNMPFLPFLPPEVPVHVPTSPYQLNPLWHLWPQGSSTRTDDVLLEISPRLWDPKSLILELGP